MHNILHKYLRVKKMLCLCVPHLLSAEQKATRRKVSQENLKILSDSGHRIITKIITPDQTYAYYYDAKINQESNI